MRGPHVALAVRLSQRDPGRSFVLGQRLQYVLLPGRRLQVWTNTVYPAHQIVYTSCWSWEQHRTPVCSSACVTLVPAGGGTKPGVGRHPRRRHSGVGPCTRRSSRSTAFCQDEASEDPLTAAKAGAVGNAGTPAETLCHPRAACCSALTGQSV